MDDKPRCIQCNQDSDQVPLFSVRFREAEIHICPQHLPILIHRPAALADELPGLEALPGAEHHH